MPGMLDELVARGLVPQQVMDTMEASRAPQLGWQRAGGGDKAPWESWREPAQEAPQQRMTELPAAPTVPTVADLYPTPGMGQAYLRSKGYDADNVQPWQVPLQGKELDEFYRRRREMVQEWQTKRQRDLYELSERRVSEQERHNREMERARLAAEKRAAEKAEEAALGKPLTATELKDMRTSFQNMDMAEKALSLLEGKNVGGQVGDRAAVGLKGYVPDPILQRIDPMGVDTRAAISNVGSLRAAERSGGAIPAHEWDRIRGFIPVSTDDPVTARKKLRQFLSEYRRALENAQTAYEGKRIPKGLQSELQRRIRPPLEEILGRD